MTIMMQTEQQDRCATFGGWAGPFFFSLALYSLTCQRGLGWQDSGHFQWRILTGEILDPDGLAISHPLYILLGKLATLLSFGHPVPAINLLSAVGMAVACGNVAVLVTMLSGRRRWGVWSGILLAVLHTPWWLATVAEVYTWHAALFTTELLALTALGRRPDWRPLAVLGLANGLAWSLHNLALLETPVYAFYFLFLVRRRRLSLNRGWAFIVPFLLGAGPLLYLFFFRVRPQTDGLLDALRHLLVGNHGPAVLSRTFLPVYLKANLALTALNLTSILFPAAAWALLRFRAKTDRESITVLKCLLVINALFFLRYFVPDQFTFVLPSLVLIAVFGGLGLAGLTDRIGRGLVDVLAVASLVAAVVVPAVGPPILDRFGVSVSQARELPYRNEARYWMQPWKHDEDSAARFVREALETAAGHGAIFVDSTVFYPLDLAARQATAQDVYLVQRSEIGDFQTLSQAIGDRAFYILAPARGYVPGWLLACGTFTPKGVLTSVELAACRSESTSEER